MKKKAMIYLVQFRDIIIPYCGIIVSDALIYMCEIQRKIYFGGLVSLSLALWCWSPVSAATVPFLSQAPLGQWRDLRQGQGCEEAVSIMAMAWAKGWKEIDKKWGRDQIVAMSNWEKKKFGYYVDTSIQDTADRLMKEYLNFDGFKVVKNITVKNVAAEVYDEGHPVIVGIDGRKIGKPYYARGGPRHHVLLVTGYDKEDDVFTFHDPGKTLGQNRTIKGPVLQSALTDYPSGNGGARNYLPPAMIVIYATTSAFNAQ